MHNVLYSIANCLKPLDICNYVFCISLYSSSVIAPFFMSWCHWFSCCMHSDLMLILFTGEIAADWVAGGSPYLRKKACWVQYYRMIAFSSESCEPTHEAVQVYSVSVSNLLNTSHVFHVSTISWTRPLCCRTWLFNTIHRPWTLCSSFTFYPHLFLLYLSYILVRSQSLDVTFCFPQSPWPGSIWPKLMGFPRV